MIAEIFLPEKLGSHRLIAQRIIGIAIQEDEVKIACIYANGSKTIIEALSSQMIEDGSEETYTSRAAQAVKKALSHFKHYHQIRVSIPASIVTFKELEVPFSDQEKIRMILDYEIESMLPFSIDEAVIDFIITKKGKDQEPSQLLVAAVRAQDLQSILDIYTQAGIEPTSITVDLCATYGLYQQIPDYQNIPHASALVDVGAMTTRIGFLQNGELRITRSIPRGVATIIKGISEELGIPTEEISKKLQLQGIAISNDDAYNRVVQKHFINFFNDIQFTLNSFSIKLSFYEGINKILFIGKIVNVNGFIKFSSDTLQIPCELFDCKKLLVIKNIKNALENSAIDWANYTVALGTAHPSEEQDSFDLRRKSFVLIPHRLIAKQLTTASFILIAIFASIGFHGYLQISQLNQAVATANEKAVAQLKTILPKEKQTKKMKLVTMVIEAEKVLREKAELWDSFSPSYRMKPLEILLQITAIFEKNLTEITINDVTMSSKEKGEQLVNIDGFYKSKQSGADHGDFTDFDKELAPKFKASKFFTLLEDIDTRPAENDKGISFPIKLKVKK